MLRSGHYSSRRLMAFALLVDPIRHPRRMLGVILIAPRAWCASTPAIAGVLALPRLMGMVLTHPAAVLSVHSQAQLNKVASAKRTAT